jgi:prepilin-type N-terminal cleavage/methylation domain-containing protein
MEKIRLLNKLKNEKGVTLVEVLAALTLLSMVLLLASSVHLFSQKQMKNQSIEIQNQSNVRLAANILTKDIRKSDSVTVINTNKFEINKANLTIDKYEFKDQTLFKNDQPLITTIQNFIIEPNPDGSISLTIDTLPKTTILIRKNR